MDVQARVRLETARDIPAIHRVEAAAFGGDGEAALVDALRERNEDFISLIASDADEIVGHIAFSRVTVEGSHEGLFLALAPLAVVPHRQRRGIGSMLVREGLEECRHRAVDAVFVVGDPAYYSRFGFQRASEFGVGCEFEVPDEAFRVIDLSRGAIRSGGLRYPAPSHQVGA